MKMKMYLLYLLVLVLIPTAAYTQNPHKPILSAHVPFEPDPVHYIVKKVIDGNTLLLTNSEKVRLIGVDTPTYEWSSFDWPILLSLQSIMRFSKVAKSYGELHIDGEAIRLEYDSANAGSGHQDKQGRTLAYVYRVSDDFFLPAQE